MEQRRFLATLGAGVLLAVSVVATPAVGATQHLDYNDLLVRVSFSQQAGEDEREGPDQPISGSALDQAMAGALAYVGEGRVSATEVGDEEGSYEVEVTLDDGTQVDVHLDEHFAVIGANAEDDEAEADKD